MLRQAQTPQGSINYTKCLLHVEGGCRIAGASIAYTYEKRMQAWEQRKWKKGQWGHLLRSCCIDLQGTRRPALFLRNSKLPWSSDLWICRSSFSKGIVVRHMSQQAESVERPPCCKPRHPEGWRRWESGLRTKRMRIMGCGYKLSK